MMCNCETTIHRSCVIRLMESSGLVIDVTTTAIEINLMNECPILCVES